MAALAHHTGSEPPPQRQSFDAAVQAQEPGGDERHDTSYQRVVGECDAVAAALQAKEEELGERTQERMAAPYPYSLLILGARGVGKTTLFIQLERQLQTRAQELEQTVRSLADSANPQASGDSASPVPDRAAASRRLSRRLSPPHGKALPNPQPQRGSRAHGGRATARACDRPPAAGLEREALSLAGASDLSPSNSALTSGSGGAFRLSLARPGATQDSPREPGSPESGAAAAPDGTPSSVPQGRGAEAAYAHREWRRSTVNLQTVQLYLAAIEGASLRPWSVDLFLWDVNDPQAAASFFYGARCVCLMYDVNDMSTLAHARRLLRDARAQGVRPQASFVLIGNKSDLRKGEGERCAEAAEWCTAEGLAYFECSAHDPSSVEHLTAHVQGEVERCTSDAWAEEGAEEGSAERRVDVRVNKSYQASGKRREPERRPSLDRLAALRRKESLTRMHARLAARQGGFAAALAAPAAAAEDAEPDGEEGPVEGDPPDQGDYAIGDGPNVVWPRAGTPLDSTAARSAARAKGLRALFDSLRPDGRGSVAKADVAGVYEYAGETPAEVGELLRQFSLRGADRVDFAEFGMLMLRLRPRHAQELFLFPTTGESAYRSPARQLRPEYQRIVDSFGEEELYPATGRRTEMLRPSTERTMRQMFNSFAVSSDRLAKKADVAAFLLRHGADTEEEVARILASYSASRDGMLSFPEFAMAVARVANPLCDPTPTPFLLRCRGAAHGVADQSRAPVAAAQLRREWERLLAAAAPRAAAAAPPRTVPRAALVDWVLALRHHTGRAPARRDVETWLRRFPAAPAADAGDGDADAVGFEAFSLSALKWWSAA